MTRLYQYIITKRKPRFLSKQEFIDICINKLKYTESESLNLYKFMQQYTKDNYYYLTDNDYSIILFDYKFKYTITEKIYYEYLKKFKFLINHNLETEFIDIAKYDKHYKEKTFDLINRLVSKHNLKYINRLDK